MNIHIWFIMQMILKRYVKQVETISPVLSEKIAELEKKRKDMYKERFLDIKNDN